MDGVDSEHGGSDEGCAARYVRSTVDRHKRMIHDECALRRGAAGAISDASTRRPHGIGCTVPDQTDSPQSYRTETQVQTSVTWATSSLW